MQKQDQIVRMCRMIVLSTFSGNKSMVGKVRVRVVCIRGFANLRNVVSLTFDLVARKT